MADVIKKSTNKFTKGLIMDFSPENTKNEVLTHALNATLLTFNGNELSLQNDMGNGRVETAFLPEGYMPVGTCEYGGIIYIVSYNPLEDKSLIGCFPSPERNISNDELGISDAKIAKNSFQGFTTITNLNGKQENIPDGSIKNTTQYVLLRNSNLNPGDKFLICSEKTLFDEQLADLQINGSLKENPIIALNVVSIEESGKITYLNSDIRQYEVKSTYETGGVEKTNTYSYHILGESESNDSGFNQLAVDIDSYRNVLSSGFSVFKSKTSGKLAILAELLMIDSYNVTHNIVPKKDENGNTLGGLFDIYIYTDISPNIEASNYSIIPKLKYYYLEKSLGYLLMFDENSNEYRKPLFKVSNNLITKKLNEDFYNTLLSSIYTPTLNSEINLNTTLSNSSKFNFPKSNTYHGTMNLYNDDFETSSDPSKIFVKFMEGAYHRIKKEQIAPTISTESNGVIIRDYTKYENYYLNELNASFYYYNPEGKAYDVYEEEEIDESLDYYTKQVTFDYINVNHDETYKNLSLFTINTYISVADAEIIANPNIEKFRQTVSTIYRKITNFPIKDSEKNNIWIQQKTDESITYVKYNEEIDPSLTYYTLTAEYAYVSLGNTIDEDEKHYLNESLYYYPLSKLYEYASLDILDSYWSDPESNILLYYRNPKDVYIAATTNEIINHEKLGILLYYSTMYNKLDSDQFERFLEMYEFDGSYKYYLLFIKVPIDTYVSFDKFLPLKLYNWIKNYYYNPTNDSDFKFIEWDYPTDTGQIPDWSEENGYPISGPNQPKDDYGNYIAYPKEMPLELCTVSDFIPSNNEEDVNYLKYNDLKLGSIKIPYILTNNGIDLPFKYDYTIVPCMNFGRLDHLKISNTVDFSKLHAFNQSNFTEWRYHIDGNQLRLTFGVEVFDTYETDKVDGLVLEFYDLWGFAGSLEISDKKAYSGVYTKIIYLNSLRGLSNKKVSRNGYITNYKRNVSITTADDSFNNFTLNGSTVLYIGPDYGWSISEENNDCGTLYSNLVYGVKTYLKRTKNKGTQSETVEFILKKDFFLYTIPLLNDYYYTVLDFSSIHKPKIDMMLTYKLQNNGSISVSDINTSIGGLSEGFISSNNDASNMVSYVNGVYKHPELHATKYYKYTGNTTLYLEVGLKKEYEDFRLSYSPEINKRFSCKLQLISDDDPNATFTVKLSEDSIVAIPQALGYVQGESTVYEINGVNNLTFEGGSSIKNLKVNKDENTSDVYNANFITTTGSSPIKIDYNFVVGYKININNIRETEVPATTVCALYHKNSEGKYNEEDFGIYRNGDLYLSCGALFNRGSVNTEVFGIGKFTSNRTGNATSTAPIDSIFLETYSYSQQAFESTTPTKLNSGEPLKHVALYIGKLTFCQPHVNSTVSYEGINIYGTSNNKHALAPDTGTHYYKDDAGPTNGRVTEHQETAHGIRPTSLMFEWPVFNMSLNTVKSLKHYSEFVSTIPYQGSWGIQVQYYVHKKSGHMKRIDWVEPVEWHDGLLVDGINAWELAEFNKKLLVTMKDVYAYNPDYDYLKINKGDVNIEDNQILFYSNLLSVDSSFEFVSRQVSDNVYQQETLNDYIYIGPFLFSKYLSLLNTFSEGNDGIKIQVLQHIETKQKTSEESEDYIIKTITLPIDHLYLEPGLKYCGRPDSPYLVSSLTYNAPVPSNLAEELQFSSANTTVVKKSDGSNIFVTGKPNKTTLYTLAYKASNPYLVLLDVTNYNIDWNGLLTFIGDVNPNENSSFIPSNITTDYSYFDEYGAYLAKDSAKTFCHTSLTINDLVYSPEKNGHRLFVRDNCFLNINAYRNIIYYRDLNDPGSWNYLDGMLNRNHLFLLSGPSFNAS